MNTVVYKSDPKVNYARPPSSKCVSSLIPPLLHPTTNSLTLSLSLMGIEIKYASKGSNYL